MGFRRLIIKVQCIFWRFANCMARAKVLQNVNGGGGYRLSAVAIMKNEGRYIKEWIDFHLKVGVEHFYIYDNGSTDNTIEEISSYVEKGIVTLIKYNGKAKQLPAYNHAIRTYKYHTEYMAFLDGDEFLMPMEGNNLYATITDIMKQDDQAGGIAVNWRVYGSSGHIKRPDGGLIKNFLYRNKDDFQGNNCIKTIVNPRRVSLWNHVHYPIYFKGYHSIDEDGKIVGDWNNHVEHPLRKIRINHYFCKSQEEWIERRSLGKADTSDKTDKRTLEQFKRHDNNDIYDDIALKLFDDDSGMKGSLSSLSQ